MEETRLASISTPRKDSDGLCLGPVPKLMYFSWVPAERAGLGPCRLGPGGISTAVGGTEEEVVSRMEECEHMKKKRVSTICFPSLTRSSVSDLPPEASTPWALT